MEDNINSCIQHFENKKNCVQKNGEKVKISDLKNKRIYIAGPMTGLTECNYPAFDNAEKLLKELGCFVVNPANIGRAYFGKKIELGEDELKWLLAEEISQLVECDAIYLLSGLETSDGARKELYHAIGNGLKIIQEHANLVL